MRRNVLIPSVDWKAMTYMLEQKEGGRRRGRLGKGKESEEERALVSFGILLLQLLFALLFAIFCCFKMLHSL